MLPNGREDATVHLQKHECETIVTPWLAYGTKRFFWLEHARWNVIPVENRITMFAIKLGQGLSAMSWQ